MTVPRIAFTYAGRPIVVEASDADLNWLLEFLQPDFDAGSSDAPADVTLERNDARCEAMLRAGRHRSGALIDCFAMDGRMHALPRWQSDSPGVVCYDAQTDTMLSVDPATGHTTIVARQGRRPARVPLLRAVRELATDHINAGGGIVLHGAAIATDAGGLVIAGAKEAGKTTLLLHLLSSGMGALLANDRVTVRTVDHRRIVRGMPTIVNVRGTSLTHLATLAPRFRASHDQYRFSIHERGEQPATPADRDAWSLTPAQLAELLDVTRAREKPLSAIIFPRRTGVADGLTVTRLSAADAIDRGANAVFDACDGMQVAALFRRASSTPTMGVEAWRAIAQTVPCFDCALGTDAYTTASAARLLEATAGRAAPR